ncbi:DUF1033 family protein [Streptococcus sp. DD10]|uniref:DUF1033 family protein n=1 Tax=Streptococcus sp. DD10 TaxID=1777878 RepID=UPI0008369AE2|nr:DUF1033 family protein [Streptococcus sp. DD10]
MYRIIEMYGDYEAWWLIDGWEEDIVSSRNFDDYYEALKYYKKLWIQKARRYPYLKSRSDLMSAFWDTKDQRWCEECDDYLQQYHSLALLEDDGRIPDSKCRPGYSKANGDLPHRLCKIKLKA